MRHAQNMCHAQSMQASAASPSKASSKRAKGSIKGSQHDNLLILLEPFLAYIISPKSAKQILLQDKLCFMIGLGNCM